MSATTSSPFRSDCLRGKVALITGGGSGICHEIAVQIGEIASIDYVANTTF